jgi:enamine deaminase RidA (YjgF/YER057c/UK114 family)
MPCTSAASAWRCPSVTTIRASSPTRHWSLDRRLHPGARGQAASRQAVAPGSGVASTLAGNEATRGAAPCPGKTGRTSVAHDRFHRFNTTGCWPNQTIDYDVSLMVRATGRSLFLGGLTGFDLEGRFHGKGDPAAQEDQAMKNLKILVEEACGRHARRVRCRRRPSGLGAGLSGASAALGRMASPSISTLAWDQLEPWPGPADG